MEDAGGGSASAHALSSEVTKHVNGLLDPVAATRLHALKCLKLILLGPGPIGGAAPLTIPHLVEEVVAKPLLRRFADPSEKCRCLSISLLSQLLGQNPECVAVLLPYIFPVISERFPLQIVPSTSAASSPEVEYKGILVELSEDVRLLLIQFLHLLLKQTKNLVGPFASDIASILMSAAADKDPVVLMEVCFTLRFFAEMMEDRLNAISKNLISAVLHALSHNRFHVRVAALQAIERLVLCGAHETIYDLTAYRDPNVIPIREFYHPSVKTQYLALLSSDRSLAVREALLRTVTHWLLELPERREHEIRLLPYVLSGFIDDNNEMQELAFDMMECIGQQYEKENEDEVKDVKQYLPEDIETTEISKRGFKLPSFLKRRPCLGARIMVKRSFGILLRALSADIQAWQQEPKVLAVKLLYVLLVFVEDNATMHLQTLILTMTKACEDPLVKKKIEECAQLLGFFVEPVSYLDILIPRINGDCNPDASIQDKGRGLIVLSWIMQGSRRSLTCHVSEICSLLTDQDLLTSLQEEVHRSILAIMDVMVAVLDESCKNEAISMLWIILNAHAIGVITGKPCHERITCCLEKLSKSLGHDKSSNIIVDYAESIIDLLLPAQLWTSHSLDAIICSRLLEAGSLMSSATHEKLSNMMAEFSIRCAELKPQEHGSMETIVIKGVLNEAITS